MIASTAVRDSGAQIGAAPTDAAPTNAAQAGGTRPSGTSRSKGLVNRILFSGVNLTAKEKKAIHKWRVAERRRLQAAHNKRENVAQRAALRAAVQKHDTAALALLTTVLRAKERARVNREFTKLRSYLTPDQRVRFDKNVVRYKLLATKADARLPKRKEKIMARK